MPSGETRTLFPNLRKEMNHVRGKSKDGGKEMKWGGTRTDTNDCSIFRLFILCGNGGWTEEDEGEEEEESEGEPREEAGGVRPRWTRHVVKRKKIGRARKS